MSQTKQQPTSPSFQTIFNKLYDEEKNKRKTLSYGIVAKEIEVSPQTIISYAKGERTPKYEQIKKMKYFFNTSYERLYGETESNTLENRHTIEVTGLSNEALKKLKIYKEDIDSWGISPFNDTPDLYFFAINKLIEQYPNILMLIGNLLTYPTKDNKYLNDEVLTRLTDERVKIPNIELLCHKITKELEKAQKEIGATREVANFSEDKLGIAEQLAEEWHETETRNQKYIKEHEKINKDK